MVRCDGDLRIYGETGGRALTIAFDEARGKQNCVFTVAPRALPIFNFPYGRTPGTPSGTAPSADVSVARGFDYNVYNKPLDVRDFGQQRNASPRRRTGSTGTEGSGASSTATAITSTARPLTTGDAAASRFSPSPTASSARRARRDVSSFGCGSDLQKEIYIEHRVGTFALRRTLRQLLRAQSKSWSDRGQVARGQKIGEAGNTGCSSGNHLHMSVLRRLIVGRALHVFRTTTAVGVDSIAGLTTVRVDGPAAHRPAGVEVFG